MSRTPDIREIAGVQASVFPTPEFRFFIYDPQGYDFIYFRSPEDRATAIPTIIASYRADDGWDDEVENVVAGEITHTCEKTDLQLRPDQVDEDGLDEEGNYWAESWAYRCDYDLFELLPQQAKDGSEVQP